MPILIEAAVESLDAALAAVEGGAHRLELCTDLAHGGTAPEGAEEIRRLVVQAKGRIEIMPGGGINPNNVARLAQQTGVREVHFSVKDAERVRAVVRNLR